MADIRIDPAEAQSIAAALVEKRKREGVWSGGVRAHTEYRGRPVQWIVDKLGIPEHTIRWSMNPEYQCCHCPRCVSLGNEGKPHIWDGEVDPLVKALELIFAGKWVSCPSGTGLGKTYVIGAAGTLAFLAVHPRSIVCSIAPKHELLLKNLWKGIGELMPQFQRHFPQANMLTGNLRMLPGDNEKEIWTASAFGAGEGADEELAGALKGFHHPAMWWIIEEGQRVSGPKYETIAKTANAEFNPIAALGNPNNKHDPLAAFGRRKRVTEVRISALDYPNYVCGRDVVPGARSRQSVLDDLEEAGGNEDSPLYLSQVRGIFPSESDTALIRQEWINACVKRGKDDLSLRDGPPAMGIDPSDTPTGDKSAFAHFQGAMCTDVPAFKAEDSNAVGRLAYTHIMDLHNPIDPKHVGVDSVGVGAGTVNELKRLGCKVRRIHGSAKAPPIVEKENVGESGRAVVGAEKFANLRSAVYWTLREDIRLVRIGLPDDPELHDELTAMEYERWPSIKLPEKDETKKKIGRSPNKADALAYGNYVRPRKAAERKKVEEPKADREVDRGLERFFERKAKDEAAERRSMKRAFRRFGRK